MGDRVAVLRDGRLQQFSPPTELYDRPANAFVAGFIGSPAMNLFNARVVSGGIDLAGTTLELPRDSIDQIAAAGLDTVTVGLRPEQLQIDRDGMGFAVTVELVEELGSESYVYGRISEASVTALDGDPITFVARSANRAPARLAETITMRVQDGGIVHLFHPQTGERIIEGDVHARNEVRDQSN